MRTNREGWKFANVTFKNMTQRVCAAILFTAIACAHPEETAADLAVRYLPELIRLDTTNPPGNETRVARYLKEVADREGIPAELLGPDPARLNFVARLAGTGKRRPLLLIAHSDVVPADRSQWSVDPLAAIEKNGYIYGRGAEDDKQLLAAELAVMIDLHRRKIVLDRDIILLSESDEEADSMGALWMIQHAWPKIRRRVRAQRVLLHPAGSVGCAALPDPDCREDPDPVQNDGAWDSGSRLAASRR
jgi:hypothetical protein